MTDSLPRVFRTATWYRILSACATLALVAFGVAGFIDVLVSRIVLERDSIRVISIVRQRTYRRSDFESA